MTWCLAPISEFPAYRERWSVLNRAGPDTVLLDPLFIEPLIAEFATGRELLCIYGDIASPVAMGIFSRPNRLAWQTFQPANAPLGAWVQQTEVPLERLLVELTRALPGLTLVVGLSQQDPDLLPRPADSVRLHTADYIETARIVIDSDFDAYWASRSKNFRRDMTRQRNRFEREELGLRLEVSTDVDAMAAAVTDYAGLELSGWKAHAASAVRPGEPQAGFYEAMLRGFAARNEAVVYRYFFADDLVASDICIERGETLIVLKTAHDARGHKGASPAQLMRQEMFADIFESGKVRTIEFYGPVMDWHRRWTDEVRRMYHLNCYRWRSVGRLHHARRLF